ncbi:response regulator transcription factor [Nonomuraea sp. FMUSA5-5]|uniref:Response regulator transcription factor n=1 Tax=Nonomuraea composti TaxID=2720023 RepID=A0ABX1B041_9ACTN|nr:response regulator transcription factor [Nonomuraea sp. FMUSA5-5]NJP89892.1 response regulator transcription factor [Nonomuraea sp. FMUSA5-5]
MIRVVVVDDQAVVREGLVLLLGLLPGIEVVGSAGDGEAALRVVETERPDVVLMDLRMPRMDGVEATGRIRAAYPDTQVVVLTTYSDDESVFAALRAGARGFLTKDADADDIASAVATVMRGDAQLDPTVQRRLLDTMAPPPSTTSTPSAPVTPTTPGTATTSPPPPASDPAPVPPAVAGTRAAVPDAGQSSGRAVTGGTGVGMRGLTPREVEVLRLIAEGLSNAEIAGRLYITEATVKTHINNLFAKAQLRDRAQAVTYAYRHGLAHPG